MAPPHQTDDGTPLKTAAQSSIYAFPFPSLYAATTPFIFGNVAGRTLVSTTTQKQSTTTISTSSTSSSDKHQQPMKRIVICSPIPSMISNLHLRQRLIPPTFIIPLVVLLLAPTVVITILTTSAHLAIGVSYVNVSRITLWLTSMTVLAGTILICYEGRSAIERHAPNDKARDKALQRSDVALPFWSLVISIVIVRVVVFGILGYIAPSLFGLANGGVVKDGAGVKWDLVRLATLRAIQVIGACIAPALGWILMSILVLLRYTGPLCPIVRCSTTPLRTNPFDAAVHRLGQNFSSKTSFLDWIANGLDGLSAPSSKPPPSPSTATITPVICITNNDVIVKQQNLSDRIKSIYKLIWNDVAILLKAAVISTNSRYSRPGLLTILVQVVVNAVGGHVFARAFVLPYLGKITLAETKIIVLLCLLVPIFELFTSIHEAELNYQHYSTVVGASLVGEFRSWPILIAIFGDVIHRLRLSMMSLTMLAPLLAATTVWLWTYLGPLGYDDSSMVHTTIPYWTTVHLLLISYVTVVIFVSILSIQDVLTRWAICAPGTDADILLFKACSIITSNDNDGATFLVEDLIIQSVLMGDALTVDSVISSHDTKSQIARSLPVPNHQEDEIRRNEMATASFSGWIENVATLSSRKLSDDILCMSILESFGGGGNSCPIQGPYYFGNLRHAAAIRKRLDLSAATASPGRQPIAVPIVRAFCAFAGGVGDSMSRFYNTIDKEGIIKNISHLGLWKLPPGALQSTEFAIIAAARMVVMNSVVTDKHGHIFVKRHGWLSLLSPCVLQSAYKLHCGIIKYAEATAIVRGQNLSTYDKTGKDDGLGCFISAECPELCPVISACKESARMIMKALVESGDKTFEDLLLKRWKGDMQKWLVTV